MEDDFNPCKENLKRWKRNAEAAESKLIEIAAEIEKWEENTSVVNVIGTVGAFGVASSAVGLIVAPPVTFVGLAIGGIGSITTLVINALKQDNIKKSLQTAKDLLDKHRNLTNELAISMEKLINFNQASIISRNCTSLEENTMISDDQEHPTFPTKRGPACHRSEESAPIDKGIVEVTTKNLKAVAMTIKGRAKDLRAEVAQKLGRLVGLETTCGPASSGWTTAYAQMKLKIHKLGEVSKIFAKCGNKLVKALEDRSSRRQQTRSAVVPTFAYSCIPSVFHLLNGCHLVRRFFGTGKTPTAQNSALAKATARTTAALGVVSHILPLVSSVEALMGGSRSNLAEKLRVVAMELKICREKFIRDILADIPPNYEP